MNFNRKRVEKANLVGKCKFDREMNFSGRVWWVLMIEGSCGAFNEPWGWWECDLINRALFDEF